MADGTLKVGTITNSAGSGNITIGSGVTLLSNTPAFEAYSTADQTISDDVYTKVQFDTERFDTDNCYDNTTNYRFTPTVAGKYFIYAFARLASTSSTGVEQADIGIYKNGSQVLNSGNNFDANDIKQHTAVINGVITFNGSSDYLEIFARINVIAGTPTIQDFNEKNVIFGAYRIGA
jgi:hypothetical protein